MTAWVGSGQHRGSQYATLGGRCQAAVSPKQGDLRSRGMPIMALHDRDTIRGQFADCVFADRDLTRPESGGFSHL